MMAMPVKNPKKPIILRRLLLKSQQTNKVPIRPEFRTNKVPIGPEFRTHKKVIKVATIPLYREDVIFESKGESFLPGEFRSVTITNKLNNITNNSKTTAKYVTHRGEIVEKTSDLLTQLIGQEAYNTLFYALCSVINQEYRIKGILTLLTPTIKKEVSSEILQSEIQIKCKSIDKACQTHETRLDIKQKKVQKRVRKILGPYVVKPDDIKLKKYIVPITGTEELPTFIANQMGVKTTEAEIKLEPFDRPFKTEELEETDRETTLSSSESGNSLPDLGFLQDDYSNDSVKTFSTLHTFKTITDLLINPLTLVNNVERHTKENDQIVLPNHKITLMDGTDLTVPFKPEDDFHIATRENLQFLDDVNRKKLLLHQMQIDYKHCWNLKDEDGNLLIHLAVINDDIELLKRQCVVLKIRNQPVDIPTSNGLTALKLSLFRESAAATSVLLQHGADPFLADDNHATCVHLAAELKTDHLSIILNHCKLNAREIIFHHAEELQKPGWQERSNEELANLLTKYICSLFDKQGYNPLMLACKLGQYENVRLLVEAVPRGVDSAMPNCGSTPLFLAVGAACTRAAELGDRSKVVDHFRKTIEILLEYGADPSIENSSGCNVNVLLQEFNCAELSMLVANKVTCTKYFKGQMDPAKNFDSYHLLKHGNNITIEELDKKNDKTSALKKYRKVKVVQPVKIPVKKEKNDNIPETKEHVDKLIAKNEKKGLKPVIVENILLKSPLKVPEKQNYRITKTDNSKLIAKSAGTVDSKDFVIIKRMVKDKETFKKAVWYPKRKADGDKTDAKRIKTKK